MPPNIFLPARDLEPRLRYPPRPMASLALDSSTRSASETPARSSGDLIDARALTAELEELLKAHTGGERELRSVLAQRLKVALAEGRAKAEQLLLKDRHGRRCAERLCRMEDQIIRILFEFAPQDFTRRRTRPKPSAWRWSRPAATAADCRRPAPTSICCSCCPTSKPPGASRSRKQSSIACGTPGSKSATPRDRSMNASARPRRT